MNRLVFPTLQVFIRTSTRTHQDFLSFQQVLILINHHPTLQHRCRWQPFVD